MLEAVLHSAEAVLVLFSIAFVGFETSRRGWYNEDSRRLMARLVNLCLPLFLFYNVTSKFTHEDLINVLQVAGLPFLTVGFNWLVSLAIVKMGWVRKEIAGAFIACFTGATVTFLGIPVISIMFGEAAIGYLLVYFFANVIFIWTIGLYSIQLDGVHRAGRSQPRLFSKRSIKMFFQPPLQGFLLGVLFVVFALPVPDPIAMITRDLGRVTSPLALVFIGMTIQHIGFEKIKHIPKEVWLILFSCFVLRPVVMYFATGWVDMSSEARQVFIVSSSMPVSSVIGVLAKNYGADEEFCSEAIGISTLALLVALPLVLTFARLV